MDLSTEIVYRVTFAVLWVVYFLQRIFFQRKINRRQDYALFQEKKDKSFFRLFALAYLLLPVYFLGSWFDFAALPLPNGLRWLGAVIAGFGLGLFSWSHQALGQNWTMVLALSNEHELVQNGPYRYVRHPMYSAFFIIGFGFLMLSANWLIGTIYLVPLTLMYRFRVSWEEKMMADRFGAAYLDYMKRTGRLLPGGRMRHAEN